MAKRKVQGMGPLETPDPMKHANICIGCGGRDGECEEAITMRRDQECRRCGCVIAAGEPVVICLGQAYCGKGCIRATEQRMRSNR